tara:strand:+ start:740 stop:850 length:111 start_codon:yes stop_codon:yes gene_type:complete
MNIITLLSLFLAVILGVLFVEILKPKKQKNIYQIII